MTLKRGDRERQTVKYYTMKAHIYKKVTDLFNNREIITLKG